MDSFSCTICKSSYHLHGLCGNTWILMQVFHWGSMLKRHLTNVSFLQMLESYGTKDAEPGLTLKGLQEIYEVDGNVDNDFRTLGLALVSLTLLSLLLHDPVPLKEKHHEKPTNALPTRRDLIADLSNGTQ